MSELANLLREAAQERRKKNQPRCGDLFDGAADEVDRLTAEGTIMREALEKIIKGPVGGWNLLLIASMTAMAQRALDSVSGSHGLPGTENCANDWHRMKCVATSNCPDCQMSTVEFNAATRADADSRQAAIEAGKLFEKFDKSFEGPLLDPTEKGRATK